MQLRLSSARFTRRFLDVIEADILPLTEKGVAAGNKVFGAAVLRKADLSLVIAGTNQETINPLYHGEVACLNAFWALPDETRPRPEDCLFLATHEPCSLCLSAITWSGFDNFYYLFAYEATRDSFGIPHDLNILEEVFACPGGAYCRANAFWESFSVLELIETLAEPEPLRTRVRHLQETYARLSERYQAQKAELDIPLD